LGTPSGALLPAFYAMANTAAFHGPATMLPIPSVPGGGNDFKHVGLGSPNLGILAAQLAGSLTPTATSTATLTTTPTASAPAPTTRTAPPPVSATPTPTVATSPPPSAPATTTPSPSVTPTSTIVLAPTTPPNNPITSGTPGVAAVSAAGQTVSYTAANSSAG